MPHLDGRRAPCLPALRLALEELAAADDDALAGAIASATALHDELEDRYWAAGEAMDAALMEQIERALDRAASLVAELEARHATRLAGSRTRVRTDTCTARRSGLERRQDRERRVLRVHGVLPRTPRGIALPRRRSAGRPAHRRPGRRAGASSRTASSDPGPGGDCRRGRVDAVAENAAAECDRERARLGVHRLQAPRQPAARGLRP